MEIFKSKDWECWWGQLFEILQAIEVIGIYIEIKKKKHT